MPNVDLSEFAGLLIISIIGVCVFSIYLGKKASISQSYILPIVIALIGLAVSGGIGETADFDDGSPEVYLTTIICAILPNIIYELFLIVAIFKEVRLKRLKDKIIIEQKRLLEINSKLKGRKVSIDLLHLIEMCGGNLSSMKNHNKVSSDLDLTEKVNRINTEINKLQMQYSIIEKGGKQV